MKEYTGKIAPCWTPTLENVTREFLTKTLYEIMFDENYPNFHFDFREKEAIDFIEQTFNDYDKKHNYLLHEKLEKMLQELRIVGVNRAEKPIMVVNDYKQFFENLRQFYEKSIELFFLRTGHSTFVEWEKDNIFKQIWLRATPDDFNNPERFLAKQIQMINDTTFEKYDTETYLGKLDFLDDNILCVKNSLARTWDENSKQIEFRIYDKDYYNNTNLLYRPQYTLPLIRYGIYEKNGNKVCCIGSIQNKQDRSYENYIEKKFNRKKYKANEGIAEEDINKVEPKNLIALGLFINLLSKEGITEIEVPSLYVLDYEFHLKRNNNLLLDFEERWSEETIKRNPEHYKKARDDFETSYNKQDIISEIKSERLLLTFRRLLQHYTKGKILSYPGDVDSSMHLSIPEVKDENDINGSLFKYLFNIQKQNDMER